MGKIDHYMVDYETEDGRVDFANDQDIVSLKAAKALGRKTSLKFGSAAVIAYEAAGYGAYLPCGDIHFYDGAITDKSGCLAV